MDQGEGLVLKWHGHYIVTGRIVIKVIMIVIVITVITVIVVIVGRVPKPQSGFRLRVGPSIQSDCRR